MKRKPIAITNWKMEMSIEEGLAFVAGFQERHDHLLEDVDVVICPPCTSLYVLAQQLGDSPIELGAQTLSEAASGAYTGEVSARLAAEAGATWAQLGHWEVRRHQKVTDETVNHKVHRALEAGLGLILFVGEPYNIPPSEAPLFLDRQLQTVLAGCSARQVGRMILLYEPESSIGVKRPASPDHVDTGCSFVRHWLAAHFGPDTARSTRIAYGGSVSPSTARGLLALPDVDGLGASRQGRKLGSFSKIIRLIAEEKARTTKVELSYAR
jgi:triosephosphate isomerase